jgi:dolichyl-phosphate-mannose--protein O-mannosyl transferase
MAVRTAIYMENSTVQGSHSNTKKCWKVEEKEWKCDAETLTVSPFKWCPSSYQLLVDTALDCRWYMTQYSDKKFIVFLSMHFLEFASYFLQSKPGALS